MVMGGNANGFLAPLASLAALMPAQRPEAADSMCTLRTPVSCPAKRHDGEAFASCPVGSRSRGLWMKVLR